VATVVGLASFNGTAPSVPVLAALLVTLIPTTVGGLLSAIGIAGMDRLTRLNVVATSGRAVEAAGDVDVLLLDKTGTVTLGKRQAAGFVPAPSVTERKLAEAAVLASLADETPEGRIHGAIELKDIIKPGMGARFNGPEWFHPRPSAAGTEGFDATSSGASNLGATSAQLLADVRARVTASGDAGLVPADAVTASGSGLDPHLSPAAAQAQVARIAAARGLPAARIAALVAEHVEARLLGLLGEPRVNVLRLDLALARLS
jgi:K+-transporting ATPase KdpC subunit